MDLFYLLLAVVFYLLSACLSFTLNKDDFTSQIYLVGGTVSLVLGVYFILAFLKANGF
jgi:hypothetical protein